MSEPLIALRGVSKRFDNGVTALDGLDLTLEEGAFFSLLGPSGCGKSTVLRLIAGLERSTGGSVAWSPQANDHEIGFVFQEPTLMPWASVFENVRLPLSLKGVSKGEAKERVDEALKRVGLEGFSGARPNQLSGGMKMRASLARALITEPRVLLLDEPFAALDEIARLRLNDDLLALWSEGGWTVVFVTHSVYEAAYLSSRVAVMSARPGRILSDVAIEAAYPRTEAFRGDPGYIATCRALSAALRGAMRDDGL